MTIGTPDTLALTSILLRLVQPGGSANQPTPSTNLPYTKKQQLVR